MDWEPDRSLQLRMLATLALIAILPLLFTYTLSLALNYVVFPLAVGADGTTPSIQFNTWIVLGLTLVGIAIAYLKGGEMALEMVNAKRVSPNEAPALHGRIQRLATTAGMPVPDLAVIDSNAPNAFATGRTSRFRSDDSQADATVAVTTGLLDTLDDEELDAVLAHELAHVRNRDATVMSIAFLLPTFTYVVSKLTYTGLSFLAEAMLYSRPTRGRNQGGKVLLIVVVAAIVTLTISALFWLISNSLFRLLSQYREYAADRGAAAITGDPLALASALEKIDDEMTALPDEDLRELDGGVEALYISSLDLPMFTDDDTHELLSQELFPNSHPPTESRIERLTDLSVALET